VADLAHLQRLTAMARRHGFPLFCDECYSEIYTAAPPAGALEAAGDGPRTSSVSVAVQALQPSRPADRVRHGDRRFIAKFLELRNVAAPQVPIPTQEVAIAAYGDEVHVEANRDLYRQNRPGRPDHRRPISSPAGRRILPCGSTSGAGRQRGGNGELWRDAGVRVLPGRYIARPGRRQHPADYIRVA
jgi:hypothetical protein